MENYKQIKSDLDELRLLVEKSELWVYKSKKDLPTETRARKITPGLVGLRKDGGSSSSKEPEQRKDSLEQQDVEAVSTSTSQVKPPPNDRNISTQHIATLLGTKCCACMVSLLRSVATLGVTGSDWTIFKLELTTPSLSRLRGNIILTTLTRDIQCEKFIEDESVSHEPRDSMYPNMC